MKLKGINFNCNLPIILIALLLESNVSNSQSGKHFWGMTPTGGNGHGVVFMTDSTGANFEWVHKIGDYPMGNPNFSHLTEANNGHLYGVTREGGTDGALFEYNPLTNAFEKVIYFDQTTTGSEPMSGLVYASNGNLYGIAMHGGAYNWGTLFEYNPATEILTKKTDFSFLANGAVPCGSLIEADNGKLYGMTTYGGTDSVGVLFEYDIAGNLLTPLYHFHDSSGSKPYGSLIQADNGLFYGLTTYGGPDDKGVIFSFNADSIKYTKLMDFDSISGSNPSGSLIQATDGNLYGMTYSGGANDFGTLFRFDIDSSDFSVLVDLSFFTSGGGARGSLFEAQAGVLFGMTTFGGPPDSMSGALFEYRISTCDIITRYHFNPDGNNATGKLMMASDGFLYGMTGAGGINDMGTLFRYDTLTHQFSLKRFLWGSLEGETPYGSLTQSQNGKLYGLTFEGGRYNLGAIFEIDPSVPSYSKVRDLTLSGNAGFHPYGTMMCASNGKMYGMTTRGGNESYGVIFEFNPDNYSCQKLFSFSNPTTGVFPTGSLIEGVNGHLYGLTEGAGNDDGGTLFEFNPLTHEFIKHHDFNGPNGIYPYGTMVIAPNGNMYGLTECGGNTFGGVIFEFDPATNTYSVEMNFDSDVTGARPTGSLCLGLNGNLFGLTALGGSFGYGVLFEYDLCTNIYSIRHNFTGDYLGGIPMGSLICASNGKLYGLTNYGGTYNKGVLFEYDPDTENYTKKSDFNGENGENPEYAFLIETGVQTGLHESIQPVPLKVFPSPCHDYICIESDLYSQSAVITIKNMSGQIMMTTDNNQKTEIIDVSSWPAGEYYVEVRNNNKTAVNRFIKL